MGLQEGEESVSFGDQWPKEPSSSVDLAHFKRSILRPRLTTHNLSISLFGIS